MFPRRNKRILDFSLIFLAIFLVILFNFEPKIPTNDVEQSETKEKISELAPITGNIIEIEAGKLEEPITETTLPFSISLPIAIPSGKSSLGSGSSSAATISLTAQEANPEDKIHSELKREIEENPEKTITVLVQVEEYEELKAKGLVLDDVGDNIKDKGGEVKGQFSYNNQICIFEGSDEISEILDGDAPTGER